MSRKSYTPGGHLTQAFVDLLDAGNAQAQLIMKAIAQHADWETGECWPAARALADIGKCSVKTVRRYLHKLRDDGLIEMEERYQNGEGENGRQTSSKITLAGYADWIAKNHDGGKVKRPAAVQKYRNPPALPDGQPDQGGDEAEPIRLAEVAVVKQTSPPLVSQGRGHGQPESPRPVVNKVTSHEQSLEIPIDPSTPNPRKRGREGSLDLLIEKIRARSGCGRIVEKLLEPLLRQRALTNAPDKEYSLGVIADWAKDFSDEVFAAAFATLMTERGTKFTQKSVENALNAARKTEKDQAEHKQRLAEQREKEANDPHGPLRQQLADTLVNGDLGRRAADEDWLVELWHWVRERGVLPVDEAQVRLVIAKRDELAEQRKAWEESLLHKRFAETSEFVRTRDNRKLRVMLGLPADADRRAA